jgi:broad specificity phosphatase PhoE
MPVERYDRAMTTVYYITHPDVAISPNVPVDRWPLSLRGRARMRTMLKSPWVSRIRAIYCSAEQKAIDGAAILSEAVNLPYVVVAQLGENDRSATGYLPGLEFESVVDEFFFRPEVSVRGWESAVDAQSRIVAATMVILRSQPYEGDIAIVAHGGVGTLLLCYLKDTSISRKHDQPPTNGGNYFAFDRTTLGLLHGWRSIEISPDENL